jgi:hypothetical protein
MRRVFSLLVIALPASAAGFYVASFVYVDRIMPHSSMAAAERSVTCRLTVMEITQLPDKLSQCIVEVEGSRTLFSAASRAVPPRFYEQVSGFLGKRVRIVGTAVNGQVSADVGHVVALAEAQVQ